MDDLLERGVKMARVRMLKVAVCFAVPAIPILSGHALAREAPTHADLTYGNHERNKLDFWQAKSATPTPGGATPLSSIGGVRTRRQSGNRRLCA